MMAAQQLTTCIHGTGLCTPSANVSIRQVESCAMMACSSSAFSGVGLRLSRVSGVVSGCGLPKRGATGLSGVPRISARATRVETEGVSTSSSSHQPGIESLQIIRDAQVPGNLAEAADLAMGVAAAANVDQRGTMRESQAEKAKRKQSERSSYQIAAIVSTIGVTALAGAAVYHRFLWQMQLGGAVPHLEMFGTMALAVGAAVGMEYWARWAHRALWHNSLWNMHESHHRPREGPFELNDVFAIINAGPAIALLAYGFFNKGIGPGLCFGAGLGITVFGIAYMFVHDGLVHKRFPVGPIADVPYLQKIAAAHQLHHADKFEGVPYGLFLGPEELARVGGTKDLEVLLESRKKAHEESANA